MNVDLKARMLDAAVVADKLWQRNVAKALTDGIAEIERLHALLFELDKATKPIVEKMQGILPLLRRLEAPTPEMYAVLTGETPYGWRRKMDKSGYEVYFLDYPDWRTVIAEPQRTVFETKDGDEAADRCEQCAVEWRYHEMLRIAAEQAVL